MPLSAVGGFTLDFEISVNFKSDNDSKQAQWSTSMYFLAVVVEISSSKTSPYRQETV